jgi:hypothetical protein
MKTYDLRQKKTQQHYFTGEIHSHVRIILKQKYSHLVAEQTAKHENTHIPVASTLAPQPSNKDRKRIVFR